MAYEYRSRDSSVNMGSPKYSTACVCSRKQRRDETSQGTWDAWCRAKVHGKLTSKLSGASDRTALTNHPEKYGKPWRSYTAGIDAVIVDHQNWTRHRLCTVAQESKHRGYGAGGMVEGYDRPSCVLPLHNRERDSDRAQHEDTAARHTYVLQATECKHSSAAVAAGKLKLKLQTN